MDDLLHELRTDVKEIKAGQLELIKQGAIHNTLLREHERRSLALEARQDKADETMALKLAPIEAHVLWVGRILRWVGTIATGVLVGAIVKVIVSNVLP